jgi:hypothetical protein
MSSVPESVLGDEQLVRYLLGLLPEEEAERLDEASVVDDEVAARLRMVEDDLVDAYANRTLSGESLARFESYYLASPLRREKVRFAESLRRSLDAASARSGTTDQVEPSPERRAVEDDRRGGLFSWLPVWRFAPSWGLPAMAAVGLLVVTTFLLQGTWLRRQLDEARSRNATLEQELASERTSAAAANAALTRLQRSPAVPDGPQTLPAIAVVLLPQARSAAGPIPAVTVGRQAHEVTFELQLDSNDFPGYQVAVKDFASQTVWRSDRLTAVTRADHAAVTVAIPADVLKPQYYAIELLGQNAAGGTQNVGTYAVQLQRPLS